MLAEAYEAAGAGDFSAVHELQALFGDPYGEGSAEQADGPARSASPRRCRTVASPTWISPTGKSPSAKTSDSTLAPSARAPRSTPLLAR